MSNVVELSGYRNQGNGAREALMDALLHHEREGHDCATYADILLSELWISGFKIVPLEPADER